MPDPDMLLKPFLGNVSCNKSVSVDNSISLTASKKVVGCLQDSILGETDDKDSSEPQTVSPHKALLKSNVKNKYVNLHY